MLYNEELIQSCGLCAWVFIDSYLGSRIRCRQSANPRTVNQVRLNEERSLRVHMNSPH